MSLPFRFVCFTDNPAGIVPEVETRDIRTLSFTPDIQGIWWKLAVLHPKAQLDGTCLFLDLDTVIVDDIDCFFTHPGRFCVIRNWIAWRKAILRPYPKIFGSSVFRFAAGAHPEAAEMFMQDPQKAQDRRLYSTEQVFMTHAIGAENATWWDSAWVKSYKYHLRPPFPLNWVVAPKIPRGAKILNLSGRPKQQEAIEHGICAGWHRRILPMPELREHWK